MREIEEAHPEAEIEVWAFDEARLGLKPITRRVWAPMGHRPQARFRRGYKWTYLYGFVHPESGRVYWADPAYRRRRAVLDGTERVRPRGGHR